MDVHAGRLGEADDAVVGHLGLADDALRARVGEEDEVVGRRHPGVRCGTGGGRSGQRERAGQGKRGGRTAVDPAELLLADEDVRAAVVVVGAFGHVRRDVILLRANA